MTLTVMPGEGPASTFFADDSEERRGWRAFARHDDMSRAHMTPPSAPTPTRKWGVGSTRIAQPCSGTGILSDQRRFCISQSSDVEDRQNALAAAEAGVYDLDRFQLFTENHWRSGGKSWLSDYYSAAYHRASFDRTLRQRVVFSDHSLVTDAVFAEMHLISCRNVLIYFDRSLHADSFEEFLREEKIYQKRSA